MKLTPTMLDLIEKMVNKEKSIAETIGNEKISDEVAIKRVFVRYQNGAVSYATLKKIRK